MGFPPLLLNFAIFAFLRYMCAPNCRIVLVLVLVFWIIYFVEEKNMLFRIALPQIHETFRCLASVSHVLTICNPGIFTQKQQFDLILSDIKMLIVITVSAILPNLLQIKGWWIVKKNIHKVSQIKSNHKMCFFIVIFFSVQQGYSSRHSKKS